MVILGSTAPRRRWLTVVLIISCNTRLFAIKPQEPPDSIPIQQLLLGPDHQDFPWKVKLQAPILTYQQRYLVRLTTAIDRGKLMKEVSFRELHYIVKAADEKGIWFSGQAYSHFHAPPDTTGKLEIDSYDGVI